MKKTAARIACSLILSMVAMMIGAPAWAAFIGGMIYGYLAIPADA